MSATLQAIEQPQIKVKHILCPTDFSPVSERAFVTAQSLAKAFGADLTVINVLPAETWQALPMDFSPELDREKFQAQEKMKGLDARIPRGKQARSLLVERGPIWEVLASVIEKRGIDLVIMGTRGRGGAVKLMLGSVAEAVLRQAPCPVLTVGPNVVHAESVEFRRILFATDFGPASAKALPYALSLAAKPGAKLVLLHMIPPVPAIAMAYVPAAGATNDFTEWQTAAKEESLKKLHALIPEEMDFSVFPELVVKTDFLPEGILDTAAERNVDLIVMGASRTAAPRLVSHIPWAVTYHVIAEARCPVLTVRS